MNYEQDHSHTHCFDGQEGHQQHPRCCICSKAHDERTALTHEQMLSEVREAVVKACPDIVDADKGFLNKNKTGWQYAFVDENGVNRHSEMVYMSQQKAYEAAVLSGRFSIRHITLEDVLRAMPHKTPGIVVHLIELWILGLPLNQQSPETIAFLHSIIVTV